MSAVIEFRDVSLALAPGRLLLDRISLALEEGTTTAILGRSGSGKTTLLRTINRLLKPTNGEILMRGTNLEATDLIAARRSMGYVIQEGGLFPHFTVERNIAVVLEAQGRSPEERKARSRELSQAVGLDPERYPHQLSGGQRQRVGLARALAADPEILLMDEPFGALDPLTRAEMQDMLRTLLLQLKKTVVLVTHDLDEALYLAQRILLLSDGKLIADLDPAAFLRSDQREVVDYVRAFHRGSRAVERS
jgi:osmoprotectant transport system ATP-binding protein